LKASYFAHPTAIVSQEASIGSRTKIWHHAQVREGAVIGKNCILGKDVYIGKDVQIGNGCKIQNRASIYMGVKIEDDVFVGPHVSFTNDKYPRAFSQQWEIGETLVRRGASIGANSTVICGVTIGEYAMVGAGSVVTKDVPPHGLVVGNPARLIGYVCKCGWPLTRLGETPLRTQIRVKCPRCGKENLVGGGDRQ